MTTTLFTTWGPKRQGCEHAHRTSAAAQLCLEDDREKCREKGIESDREIRKIESTLEALSFDEEKGPGRPLTESEMPG